MMPNGAGPSRPPRYAWKRNKAFQFLASLRLAVILLSVLILVSIAGTIFESKFDSDTARIWFYEAPWFHLWLLFLAANLTCSAFMRWPWKRHHTGFLLTHLGIIVVMVGAVIGWIWGIEGTMTLFKDSPPDNALVLQKRQLTVRDPDARRAVTMHLGRGALRVSKDKPVDIWTTPSGWNIEAVADSDRVLGSFEPTPAADGKTAVRVRLQTKAMGQNIDQWLLAGDRDRARLDLGLITVDLVAPGTEAPVAGAANRAIIRVQPDGALRLQLVAHGQTTADTPMAAGTALATGWRDWTIEAAQILPSAQPGFRFEEVAADQKPPAGQPLLEGVQIRMTRGEQSITQWVGAGWRVVFPTGAFPLEVSYGWEVHRLPFGLVLEDFVVDRNEGSDEPASFRSDLAMMLPDGKVDGTGSCSMNRPANYPQAFWRSLTGLTYKISQASWNPNDLTQSSVQILRDPGWLCKWVGSLILCAGLVTMFTMRKPAATESAARRAATTLPQKTPSLVS